ncbi:MAG: branched-chain amino acid transport system II carrier protein [Simkaniaceae bacterium]
MAVIIMLLLGPLGSTPRCIALSFSTLQSFLPELSPILFSAAACFAVFLLTMNKKNLLQVLGKILTPFLLLSIAIILFKGLLLPAKPRNVPFSSAAVFWQGLKEGYNTMDLLAAFFFSSTVLRLIKRREEGDNKQSIRIALQASFIGGFLLAAVYIGFSYLASFQGAEFLGASKDKLLNLITLKVAGPYAGLLICLTIALACLTTAVALTSVFADFLQKDIFKDKISYRSSLMYSLFMTFIVANFQFNGISAFLGPILEICYPALIVLTFINLGNKLFQIKSVKAPVYAALAGSIALHLF